MNEFLKYLEDMKKEKATWRVEGSRKELNLKTDLGELKEL